MVIPLLHNQDLTPMLVTPCFSENYTLDPTQTESATEENLYRYKNVSCFLNLNSCFQISTQL